MRRCEGEKMMWKEEGGDGMVTEKQKPHKAIWWEKRNKPDFMFFQDTLHFGTESITFALSRFEKHTNQKESNRPKKNQGPNTETANKTGPKSLSKPLQ